MNEGMKPDSLTVHDWRKLAAWWADPARKPAMFAFTQGAARDAATAYEFSMVIEEKSRATLLEDIAHFIVTDGQGKCVSDASAQALAAEILTRFGD